MSRLAVAAAAAAEAAAAAATAVGEAAAGEAAGAVEARTAKGGSISQRPNGLRCRGTREGTG